MKSKHYMIQDKMITRIQASAWFPLLLAVITVSGCGERSGRNSNTQEPSAAIEERTAVPREFLSAEESAPHNFDWMQGFPPAPDRRLSAIDGSFFRFPALRWSVVHMREFFPTANVARGPGAAHSFEYAIDTGIDAIRFLPWNAPDSMTWEASLGINYTDGILILHRGRIVYEKYFAELSEERVHAIMSLTKSFTGTLASILVAEGRLDENAMVPEYVPPLKGSAFGDATVRQVMDMTTGVRFSEDYADPNAEIWAFGAAGNPLSKREDDQGPVGYFEYLKTLKKEGRHGHAFGYKTVNSDALGWIMSGSTGQKLSEMLARRIWMQLGMEQDAYYQIDALGTPFAGGGLNAGLRDLGRFGEMMRNRGRWRGRQIIPEKAVLDIEQGGDREAFARSGYHTLKGWSYRNMWWISHNEHRVYAARGVHGQAIYIDPAAEMVIVRLASHPVAGNAANDPYSLPAYHAVARYLMGK